jgi:hypothetical protein
MTPIVIARPPKAPRGSALFVGLSLLALWTIMGRAAAQEVDSSSDVVLLVPETVRSEWTAALQVELAARGARVIPGEPPAGETVLLRDAEAQRSAIEHDAAAAARVEEDESGYTLRVIGRDAATARATPVAREADARTVALILVSLLDDPETTVTAAAVPLPPVPPPPPEPPPADPSAASPSTEPVDAETASAETAETGGPEWSGRIGTGGFGLVNDRRFIPGAMLRGGVGVRARFFEIALLAEGGIMIDSLSNAGTEIQPLIRGCVEAGTAIPLGGDKLAFHVGARGCGGYAELRVAEFDPFFGGTFPVDQSGVVLSGGGYLALSIGLGGSVDLFIRADVEGAYVEASMHFGEVLPILSTILSFH